jgi:hypothetical protein
VAARDRVSHKVFSFLEMDRNLGREGEGGVGVRPVRDCVTWKRPRTRTTTPLQQHRTNKRVGTGHMM